MRVYDHSGGFSKACQSLGVNPSRLRCPICGSSSGLSATSIPKGMGALYSAHFRCSDCDWSDYEPHLIEEGVLWKDILCAQCGRDLVSLEIDTSSPDPCRSYVRTGVKTHRLPGEVGYVVCPADGSRTPLSNFAEA
jgi:hypothetical protein